MPKNKRKFIDKKHAITFHLVHRSQRDPLITDEKAPQHVLKEVTSKKIEDEQKEENLKYGIYFDDDYDYMQHLKPVEGKGELVITNAKPTKERGARTLELPSSVFQSHIEEKVGVLNKAAPKSGLQLDLDPDIVAAMDEDFDYSDPENELEDNFIELANGTVDVSEGEDATSDFSSDGYEDEDSDEVNSLDMVETKSHFTNYSMSSSVIRRNEQLSLLDDKFEGIFNAYDETEIGAIENEDIEGFIDPKSNLLIQYAEEFEKEQQPTPLLLEHTEVESEAESSESGESIIEIKEKEQWDCESVLSTYSNLYNHPKVIEAPSSKIKVNPKTGIPISNLKLTPKTLAALEDNDNYSRATGPGSLRSMVSILSIRPKNENPKERQIRKKSFKEFKKERRMERKCNTEAFKEEKKLMEKMRANNKSKFIVHI